jgi:cytochrome c oxidase subunit II
MLGKFNQVKHLLIKLVVFLNLSLCGSLSFAAADPWQMNMYKGVTPVSHAIYNLHMIVIAVCIMIGIVVFGVMLHSMIHHRKSKGYKAATFHTNTRLEFIWTAIPFLILVGLAFPATRALVLMSDDSQSEITIKIVGSQWRWRYEYLEQGIKFYSNLATPDAQIQNKQPKGEWYLLEVDKPLVLPIHKKIRFLVTSSDVVHSWWVPELGIKRDAIPGFIHESWARISKPGTYRGQCTELCGIYHGFMPIVVQAVTESEFDTWVKEQQQLNAAPKVEPRKMTRKELLSQGKLRYEQVCAPCHQVDGTGIPPMFPALKGSSVTVGYPISRHIELILNGVAGTAMQAYQEQLSDEDIAAITTYERNAWGNKTNDQIQPSDVAKVRESLVQAPVMVNKAKLGGLQ